MTLAGTCFDIPTIKALYIIIGYNWITDYKGQPAIISIRVLFIIYRVNAHKPVITLFVWYWSVSRFFSRASLSMILLTFELSTNIN